LRVEAGRCESHALFGVAPCSSSFEVRTLARCPKKLKLCRYKTGLAESLLQGYSLAV
jgi:hypothetical protein